MKKKLGILLMAILSLSMVLVGCKSQSPTDVVSSYFEQLKKGDSEQASEFIEDTISKTEGTKEETNEESDKIMEEALKLYLSKIDAKVVSEKIDGDKATVKVDLEGPNFSNIMMEVIQESFVNAFSGKETSEVEMSKGVLEKVKSSKNENRTGEIDLVKKDKEWRIKSNDNLLTLMLGKSTNQGNISGK